MAEEDMRLRIREIMEDSSLTDAEKAEARQKLFMGTAGASETKLAGKNATDKEQLLDDASSKCAICLGALERPVTAPCGHNYCLACFRRWAKQEQKACPTCRAKFPRTFINTPRVNTLLVDAIRLFKAGDKKSSKKEAKPFVRLDDQSRPSEAFQTERSRRNGIANAASGRIFVNVANDWFGPILSEHDPTNHRGVCVGDWYNNRMQCRQYGVHFPHVAGIAGQAHRGAQSVVLSGGYEDDLDNGDWFLYTGSGGRDLSGNRRTNKQQSFDQEFKQFNEALRVSCQEGLPIRVVRSYKEKSFYAPPPEYPCRYDGIYRILRCWRNRGKQKFIMCRYLFVRCDNAPAPWSSSDAGDDLRLEIPKEAQKEIDAAVGPVFCMTSTPYWDIDEKTKKWGFVREQPEHQASKERQPSKPANPRRALKKFKCGVCSEILKFPVTTPCGHTFCKECLENEFKELSENIERATNSGRVLRTRKTLKPCPECKIDIAPFMKSVPINRELETIIQKLCDSVKELENTAPEKTTSELSTPNLTPKSETGVESLLEDLCIDYPEIEKNVIQGLLNVQNNDTENVISTLEKMREMSLKDGKNSKRNLENSNEIGRNKKKRNEEVEASKEAEVPK